MTGYDTRPSLTPEPQDLVEMKAFQSLAPRTEALIFPLLGKVLGTTDDSNHFRQIDVAREIMIPLPPHPGAFGVVRKFHTHEGIDLYCDDGAPVFAMESGTIVAIEDFTGVAAASPWWFDTKSLLVEGEAGVVCYGEIEPQEGLQVGDSVTEGQRLGVVKMVLKKDKGRPRSMLHLELHLPGATQTSPWTHDRARPATLLDPTPLLVEAARQRMHEHQPPE